MTVLSPLQDCAATIEALIFASDRPIRERELIRHLPENMDFAEVIAAVALRYGATSGIELCQVGDGWAFRTKAEIAERLSQHKQVERPLSRAALEVLAIIAYHQPVTRAEIEDIRGVAVAKGTVDTLLEAGWIKPRGRKQTPGRPLMWGTTDAFLDHFGLSTVKELPGMDELKAAGLLDKREGLASLPTSEDDNDDETETELEMEDGEEAVDAGTSADVIQLDQAR